MAERLQPLGGAPTLAERLLALSVLALAAAQLSGCGGASPTPAPPSPPPPPPPPPWATACASSCSAEGYVQNWGNTVNWWDHGIPGNCIVGCFEPHRLLKAIAPYQSLIYRGVWLTEDFTSKPECPTGVDCCEKPDDCPVWDGKAIYVAAVTGKPGDGAIVVNDTVSASHVTPGMVSISEAVRLARMHPAGPKKMKITLGGWSDYARIDSAENGRKIGKMMAKLVQWTFADGADLDLEHLTPFAAKGDEYVGFAALAQTLRSEFDDVVLPHWKASAQARLDALQKEFGSLPDGYTKTQMRTFYDNQQKYLKEVANNPPERLELSWTTRFNAFVPADDSYNYISDDSRRPTKTCSTDNEGANLWSQTAEYFDLVHIMGYDAAVTNSATGEVDTFKLNFTKVLDNFVELGPVPPTKLILGLGPGEQDAGAQWEGMDADVAALHFMNASGSPSDGGYGGSFVWSANSDDTSPVRFDQAPVLAARIDEILKPRQLWSSVPQYTTCNPRTGDWPANAAEEFV